jgi:FtsP/CotA-like multicopper oxidase with cupredoxin domain
LSLALLVVTSLLVAVPALALNGAPAPATRPVTRPLHATVTVDLCAKAGTVTMPDSVVVDIWGFVLDTGSCAGSPTLPGPQITANEGDTLIVNLTNMLSQPVSLIFPGQSLMPDTVGAAGGGGFTSYTFTASNPGTYLYETGTNPGAQQPMGLYGALVVNSSTAGTLYGGGDTAFDVEQVMVLSELDPALNASIAAGEVPTSTQLLLDYNPQYWLINGLAYPSTVNVSAAAGEVVALRYVNAGLQHHTLQLLGARQRAVAKDAYPLGVPYDAVSETIPSGATADMLVTVPASASSGDKFALYSRSLYLTNGASFPGGMLTYIEVP